MSAQSVLAGMYPPDNAQVWNDGVGLYWQPIPVHVVPVTYDTVSIPGVYCQKKS